MKQIIALLFLTFLFSGTVFAEDICEAELNPFIKKVQAYDNSESSKKDLIYQYHSRTQAIYSICDREMIRKFESAWRSTKIVENPSQFAKMTYFPKPRETVDLGEVSLQQN